MERVDPGNGARQGLGKILFFIPALNEAMWSCPELDSGYFRITAFDYGIFDQIP
jgi:hypothetical protein